MNIGSNNTFSNTSELLIKIVFYNVVYTILYH